MPTYVYKFVDTGETIEVQQAFTDDTLTEHVHPESGTTMAVKKVFQPVGVTFKGDGFYKNDSRGSGATRRSKESSDSSESSSSGASSNGSSGADSSGSSGSSGSSDSGATGGDSSSTSSKRDSGSTTTPPSTAAD